MSYRRRLRARAAALALTAVLSLLALASVARAAGVVPAEGGWVATTSAGLPVSFEVQGASVLNAHFGFSWGFCGNFESRLANTSPIDADGHWSFHDSRGQTIEATFLAPDRAEGTVVSVERQLPGCPQTEATFVAAPGEIPPLPTPEVFAVQNASSGRVAKRPHDISLKKDGSFSFHRLAWRDFGERVAHAGGRAEIHRVGREWSPRAALRFSSLIEVDPGKRIYSVMSWTLRGPLPRGLPRHNFRLLG